MSGRANPNQYSYDSGFSQLQNQVDEVKGVMKNNIENVLKRGENLDDLANKSSHLEDSALQFSKTSTNLKRRLWWKNTKLTIVLVVVFLAVLGTIIGIVIWKVSPKKESTTTILTTLTTKAVKHHRKHV